MLLLTAVLIDLHNCPELLQSLICIMVISNLLRLLSQLEAREPFYMKADYIIQAPVKEIAAEDDQYIAEMLYKLITTK